MTAMDDGRGAPARCPEPAYPPPDAPATRTWSPDDVDRLCSGILHGRPGTHLAEDLDRSLDDLLAKARALLADVGIGLPDGASGQALDVLWAHLLTTPARPAVRSSPSPIGPLGPVGRRTETPDVLTPDRPSPATDTSAPAVADAPPAPPTAGPDALPEDPVGGDGPPVLVAGGVGTATVLDTWLELTGIPLDGTQRSAFLAHPDTRALGTVRRHRLRVTGRDLHRRHGALYLPDWREACASYDVGTALPVLAGPGDPAWATATRRLLAATVDDVADAGQRHALRGVLGLLESGPVTPPELARAGDTPADAVRRDLRAGLAAICAAADEPGTPATHLRRHLRPAAWHGENGSTDERTTDPPGFPTPVVALAERLAGVGPLTTRPGPRDRGTASDPRRASLIAALARMAGYAPVPAQQLAGRALTPYRRPPNLGRGVRVR